jgi:DNA-directed RNA polymerase III subunit RPC4
MPPKGSRGGGRGRGRGRGKATASSTAEPAAEPAADVPMTGTDDRPESKSALAASPPPASELSNAKITTPQNLLEDDSAPSPNSSPATVPTETPAPTPVRVPLQRTESTGSASVPPTRGGRGGRGKGAAESRFKPKNIRRDAGELQELAQKEQARLAGIAQDRAREEAKLVRGRGRPPRGRGDVMGRGAAVGRATATASGVFSVAPEALGK